MRAVRDSVTVHMKASPDEVWALVSDVTRIGEYSPETFEAEWLDGATGPSVGARFRGHVKRNGKGPPYWTTCRVVASEPGREFAFGVGPGRRPVNVWRYQLEAAGDGTDVTESFELADIVPIRLYWKLLGWARGRTNRDGMRTTLDAMKAEVDAG
ncbi:SRPBCC family protein [soil metagenome]